MEEGAGLGHGDVASPERHLMQNAAGDYRPDPDAAHFPAPEILINDGKVAAIDMFGCDHIPGPEPEILRDDSFCLTKVLVHRFAMNFGSRFVKDND
jgi:hypothetical protein